MSVWICRSHMYFTEVYYYELIKFCLYSNGTASFVTLTITILKKEGGCEKV